MPELFVYLAGLLLTVGAYLVLQRGLVRILFGIVLIGNAMNLAIMALGRSQGAPPIVPPGATEPLGAVANPLPQALFLLAQLPALYCRATSVEIGAGQKQLVQ